MGDSAAMAFNPLTATAAELQACLQTGNISSVDLVEQYLNQTNKHESYLKALISQPSRSYLMEQAKSLDRERASGNVRSALHGIPILIKDNMATDSQLKLDTTAGSFALVGAQPKKNARVVDMLLSAGAIIIGKTNLSELSFFKGSALDCGWSAVGGQTQSAYVRGGFLKDDTFAGHSNPGGSSSGSAVSVSAGYAPVSLGTETEGSLILPASRAALYTLKPTISIVPQEGIIPINSLFDSAGPMTKSALDLAILMDVIVDAQKTSGKPVGGYVTAANGSWDGLKIGTLDPDQWRTPTFARKAEPEADQQMFDDTYQAYKKLETLAPYVEQNVDLISSEEFEIAGKHVIPTLSAQDFREEFANYLSGVDGSSVVDGLDALIRFNREHAATELPARNPRQDRLTEAAQMKLSKEERDSMIAHMRWVGRDRGIDELFARRGINAVIGPAESALCQFASVAGYPIASLPLGYLRFNGRPHGLAAIAKAHEEARLIQLQSAWEVSFPARRPPPMLLLPSSSSSSS